MLWYHCLKLQRIGTGITKGDLIGLTKSLRYCYRPGLCFLLILSLSDNVVLFDYNAAIVHLAVPEGAGRRRRR